MNLKSTFLLGSTEVNNSNAFTQTPMLKYYHICMRRGNEGEQTNKKKQYKVPGKSGNRKFD